MEKSSATSSDALVLSHFSRQIFQALGYPDRSTAIIKRKWRVAVSYTFDKICWLTIIWCNYHLMFILGNICGLLSSVLRSKQPNRAWSPTCNVNTSLWHNHHVSPHHVDADPAQQPLFFFTGWVVYSLREKQKTTLWISRSCSKYIPSFPKREYWNVRSFFSR